MYKAAIITISDKGAAGIRDDRSGPALMKCLEKAGLIVKISRIIPDELDQIKAVLIELSDMNDLDLILTTGGTGLSPRDVTPEATKMVIEKSYEHYERKEDDQGGNSEVRVLLEAIRPKALLH